MFMNGSPQTRYEIIAETIAHDDNLLNIAYMCEIAGVSRSGFYYWQRNGTKRSEPKNRIAKILTLSLLPSGIADMTKALAAFT
jgi:predicted DNA-binding transcriptional regulator AlpA